MIFEFIAEVAVQFIGEVICYGTGRILLLSCFGNRARVEEYTAAKSFTYSKAFRRDGDIMYFDDGLVTLLGMLFYILLGVLAYFFFR